MDPALKQRLIGATVLIVLAIIFVPMLIDSTPRTDGETVDLTIPAMPEQQFETQIVPLNVPGNPSAVVADDPNRVATVDTQAPQRTDALAGSEPSVSEVAPSPTTSTAPTVPVPEPPAPQAASVATQTAPAPSAASSGSPAAPVSPAPSGGRFVVHFGSFAVRDNAQSLAAELVRAGVRASTEVVDINGTPGLRVRAGPYADRTSAEKARLAARKARPDVNGMVIETDDGGGSDHASAPAGRVVGWAVQVGALASVADANALRDKLRAGGFTAYVESLRGERGTLYRVRVGPETQRANAERIRTALKTRFSLDGQIVSHP